MQAIENEKVVVAGREAESNSCKMFTRRAEEAQKGDFAGVLFWLVAGELLKLCARVLLPPTQTVWVESLSSTSIDHASINSCRCTTIKWLAIIITHRASQVKPYPCKSHMLYISIPQSIAFASTRVPPYSKRRRSDFIRNTVFDAKLESPMCPVDGLHSIESSTVGLSV
jgi:hypothetical protein